MVSVKRTYTRLVDSYNHSGMMIGALAERHANFLLFLFGVLLVSLGSNELAHAQADSGDYTEACGRLLALIEGPFGALITVGAGVGAIIASAVGGFKMAWTLVVVAIGAFILRAYITLFFAPCFASATGGPKAVN